jgi:branched-chain amino acid transport system substrate-binding protein
MPKQLRYLAVIAALVLALVAVGCGDDEEPASGGGGGSESSSEPIKFTAMLDLTGAAAVYAPSDRAGIEFAVQEINDAGGINGRKLEPEFVDTGSDQKQGVSLMTEAAQGDTLAVISGNISSVAVATAPIAQREGLPQIGIQSGSPGFVDVGDKIFRITMPQTFLYENAAKYVAEEKGVKTTAVVYGADVPTLEEVATDAWPKAAEKHGIKVTSTHKTQSDDKDYSSVIRKIASENPDGVLIAGLGQANITIASQLRRAGWEGQIIATPGVAGGVLKALKDQADGIVYPVSFHPDANPEFSEKFKAAKDMDADNFVAESYDAVQLLKAGIEKAEGELTRESLAEGLKKAAAEGIKGAQGDITFEDGDARTAGVVVEWQDGKEKLGLNAAEEG